MPTMTIPEKLLPLIQKQKRFKIAYGGRGATKSNTFADLCLMKAQDGIKVGCFREYQNTIEDSVHALLKAEIARLELTGFQVHNNVIYHGRGGEFRFRGLARNPDGIKSMHGFRLFWVEEAQTLSDESLKLLTPTLREDDSEIWMSANPMSSADPFSVRFIEPFKRELDRCGYYEDDLHLIVKINYYDNPWFPAVLDRERLFDKAHLSEAEYAHIWLGEYNDTVAGAIIPVAWFNAAVGAAEKLGIQPRGAIICAHDPSDTGPDPKGLVLRHGSSILAVEEKPDGDVNEGGDWAAEYANAHKADVFRWDCDGLGVGLRRQLGSFFAGKRTTLEMFKGSESVDNPGDVYQPDPNYTSEQCRTNEQTFRNKRSQYYFALRDRFRATHEAVVKGRYMDPDTLISLDPDMPLLQRLRSEVCRIPKKQNANGLLQIMTKVDMMRQKPPIRSPNLADALMMTMPAPNVAATRPKVRQVRPVQMGAWT